MPRTWKSGRFVMLGLAVTAVAIIAAPATPCCRSLYVQQMFQVAAAPVQQAPVAPAKEQAKDWAPSVAAIKKKIDTEITSLEELYTQLHANPELSFQEKNSAARVAKELKALGFEVTTDVGGHGVVAVLKNGAGPTVMVRADMDALPITETTGLPYASKQQARTKLGKEVGVMHACGHDMHMTCLIGTARTLTALKDQWKGTLVMIGQPAEEVGGGARRMINDGLFKRFPRPDYCLGLHCEAKKPFGHVSFAEGLLCANVDSIDITVLGKGGHGSQPHSTIDPIVIASRIVLDLQTLVSREIQPGEPAVVTVGAFHAGAQHNIIPPEAKLHLTVRTLKDDVRKHVLDGIQRIAKAAADAARAPAPIIDIEQDDFTPAVFNDAALARKTTAVFREILGKDKVHEVPPTMGGEDFGRYGREGIPIFFYFLGTLPADRVAAAEKGGEPLPSLHSDKYYPTPEPSIRTGVLTMSAAVMNLMPK